MGQTDEFKLHLAFFASWFTQNDASCWHLMHGVCVCVRGVGGYIALTVYSAIQAWSPMCMETYTDDAADLSASVISEKDHQHLGIIKMDYIFYN